MTGHAQAPGHRTALVQGPGSWITAIFIAIMINFGVLALMPKLLDRRTDTQQEFADIHKVDFIRVKSMAALKKKAVEKRASTGERKPAPAKAATAAEPFVNRSNLPIHIGARLPAGIGIGNLPPIEPVAFDGIGTKSVFTQDELDTPLIPLTQVPPVYPLRARRQGTEGWVSVSFLVNAEGRVESVSILKSSPPKVFDQSVLRCIRAWRFKSGTISGVPVNTRVETTVRFKLK